MLFNSHIFIFAFLPVVVTGFYLFGMRAKAYAAIVWVVLCSLFFYGWWNPAYLWLLCGSLVVNYTIGRKLLAMDKGRLAKILLIVGVGLNLAALGYYKYADFFISSLEQTGTATFKLAPITLPLAISFFTFEQIAWLVDAARKEARHYRFFHYCLFVTFFPQLIAGPIAHHSEVLPQVEHRKSFKPLASHFAVGLTLFFIGLFKKTVLADTAALYASPVFDRALMPGATFTLLEGWGASLAYTFQLYFDFSGYSDMALGLARLFGIYLPLNFFSPLKAKNIISFWHRWHMTLSRFLRDYLYIPLGGNRKGNLQRHINLMMTMLLGGLWHGAGWTFVLWGGLNGLLLVINHGWRHLEKLGKVPALLTAFVLRIRMPLTFICVVLLCVLFRAGDMTAATTVYKSLVGQHGLTMPVAALDMLDNFGAIGTWLESSGWASFENSNYFTGWPELAFLLFCGIIALKMPNAAEILAPFKPALITDVHQKDPIAPQSDTVAFPFTWKPTRKHAFVCAVIAIVAVIGMSRISEFIYFNF